MKRKIQIGLFLLLCIIQLYIISSLVYKAVTKKNILKLKCRSYDPYDPLKGRYLALGYEIDIQDINNLWQLKNEMGIKDIKKIKRSELDKFVDKKIYCIFSRYDNNLQTISFKKPPSDELYVSAKIVYFYGYKEWDGRFRLEFSFNKYYIQENLASQAEDLLSGLDEKEFKELDPTIVLLVDNNGIARIDRLEVRGMKIEKYLLFEKQNKK